MEEAAENENAEEAEDDKAEVADAETSEYVPSGKVRPIYHTTVEACIITKRADCFHS